MLNLCENIFLVFFWLVLLVNSHSMSWLRCCSFCFSFVLFLCAVFFYFSFSIFFHFVFGVCLYLQWKLCGYGCVFSAVCFSFFIFLKQISTLYPYLVFIFMWWIYMPKIFYKTQKKMFVFWLYGFINNICLSTKKKRKKQNKINK